MPTENLEPTAEHRSKRAYKKRLTKSDADRAVAAIIVTHRFIKKDILAALRTDACKPGTNARLSHLKALQDLEIDFQKQMTAMGVLPKNVTSQTNTQYVFKAHVSKGGSVQTLAVSPKQLAELEKSEAKEFNKGAADTPDDDIIREQLEAEYGSSATAQGKQ
jgi:hypothetical protein